MRPLRYGRCRTGRAHCAWAVRVSRPSPCAGLAKVKLWQVVPCGVHVVAAGRSLWPVARVCRCCAVFFAWVGPPTAGRCLGVWSLRRGLRLGVVATARHCLSRSRLCCRAVLSGPSWSYTCVDRAMAGSLARTAVLRNLRRCRRRAGGVVFACFAVYVTWVAITPVSTSLPEAASALCAGLAAPDCPVAQAPTAWA